MNNRQLNNLVISYQDNKEERVFNKVYKEVRRRWRREKVFLLLSKRYGLIQSDIESLSNEVIIDIVTTYKDIGDFYNMLSSRLSSRCIDERRKLSFRGRREFSLHEAITDDGDEEASPIIKFLEDENAEDEAFIKLQKESDQRQLIANLIDKAPENSRQAIEAYVESNFSYTNAAKQLGVKYDTVKRRVEKVATCHDANRDGSYIDYFTVATTG